MPETRPTEDWVDLAANRPGQAVRTVAEAELSAQRERSRFRSGLARLLDVHTDERAWRRGAEGEEAVGLRLEKLTKRGWLFVHSVPVGTRGSDIDHVAIGPGGAFTLNTKNHVGKRVYVNAKGVRVSGQRVPYVRNSQHEAERASRLLTDAVGFPVFCTGVVVVLADELTHKGHPEPVKVVGRKDIAGWLRRQPEALGSEQIATLYAAARRSTTWQPTTG
jgi:hypothetical protein